MDEKKDGGVKKPFYENIASRRKRSDNPARAGSRPRTGTGTGTGVNAGENRARDGAKGESRPRIEGERPRDGDRAQRSAPGRSRDDRPGHRDAARSDSRDKPRAPRKTFMAPRELEPVFKKLLPETRSLLDAFPEIVQSVMPLDSKRLQQLPGEIRELSHSLTDERGDRRVGYMNEPSVIGAYVRYYMWWNLVRLTRVLSGLPLALNDGDAAVDLGSGPLTLPIALWMSRPELRDRKLTWYCVDISQGALAAGEELFLSLAARTGNEPWKIVRIKGECGVSLRRRVSFVASANMFNELFWDNPAPLEQQVKHHASELVSYAESDASILIVEPGVPRAGRFISLMRDALIRSGFSVSTPCPHELSCPFPGLRTGKWCHFVFDTTDAPTKLHKLSEDAGLAKDRAALSFVFAERKALARSTDGDGEGDDAVALPDGASVAQPSAGGTSSVSSVGKAAAGGAVDSLSMVSRMAGLFPDLRVRITSDTIKLPDYYIGRYGCSELGMVMLMGTYGAADYLKGCHSGSLVEVPMPDRKRAERDQKTGAIIIRLQ